MKKILIVNQHFDIGGIKKTLLNLIDNLKDKYSIDLLLLKSPLTSINIQGINLLPSPFLIDAFLSSKQELSKKHFYLLRLFVKAFFRLFSLFFGERTALLFSLSFCKKRHYDCAISYTNDIFYKKGFTGGCNYYVSKKVVANIKIGWLHAEPSFLGLTKKSIEKTYNDFNYVVNVSNACKEAFDKYCANLNSCKSIYIRNLFNINDIVEKSKEECEFDKIKSFKIVTVSRLEATAKRIDRINTIASRLKNDGFDFCWIVVGDGPCYLKCIEDSKKMNLENCVFYLRSRLNPYPYIRTADLFVLPSTSESFSLVINEAFILDIPVVCTNFPAARESVENNCTGYLTNDDEMSLYEGIKNLINDKSELERMKKNIANTNKYSNDESLSKIISMIESSN